MEDTKTIVIISCGQPSTSPRSVKEAICLQQQGYKVIYIYAFSTLWAKDTDEVIISNNSNITWLRVKGYPYIDRWYYFYTRVRYKLFVLGAGLFPRSLFWQERAVIRCTPELKKAAKKQKASLYIAHNLGALPAAAYAAKRNNSIYAFDAEDYHRGETQDSKLYDRTQLVEDKYLPGASYFSTASPIMVQKYKEHYFFLNPVLINNFFPKGQQPVFRSLSINKDQPLRLIWFSQSIGLNRGIQDAIDACNLISGFGIEITLIGNGDEALKRQLARGLVNAKHRIVFKAPLPEKDLITECSYYHIGLALEPGFSPNNDAALSNKIMTYVLAGNAIIATATTAQKQFVEAYPCIGVLYRPGDAKQLADILISLHSDFQRLDGMRRKAYELAGTELNWENEQKVLLKKVAEVCREKY